MSKALLSWVVVCLLFWWCYLSCLVTTQICENQAIWRLEIPLRTIVAAFLKTKDIKKRPRNILQKCKWSWKMRVTNILLLGQHLIMPTQPILRPTNTHQQKGHCLPSDLCPSHLQPTQPFFQFLSRRMHKFSHHTTAQNKIKFIP